MGRILLVVANPAAPNIIAHRIVHLCQPPTTASISAIGPLLTNLPLSRITHWSHSGNLGEMFYVSRQRIWSAVLASTDWTGKNILGGSAGVRE